jgi:pentatricopeptide repeat protein
MYVHKMAQEFIKQGESDSIKINTLKESLIEGLAINQRGIETAFELYKSLESVASIHTVEALVKGLSAWGFPEQAESVMKEMKSKNANFDKPSMPMFASRNDYFYFYSHSVICFVVEIFFF